MRHDYVSAGEIWEEKSTGLEVIVTDEYRTMESDWVVDFQYVDGPDGETETMNFRGEFDEQFEYVSTPVAKPRLMFEDIKPGSIIRMEHPAGDRIVGREVDSVYSVKVGKRCEYVRDLLDVGWKITGHATPPEGQPSEEVEISQEYEDRWVNVADVRKGDVFLGKWAGNDTFIRRAKEKKLEFQFGAAGVATILGITNVRGMWVHPTEGDEHAVYVSMEGITTPAKEVEEFTADVTIDPATARDSLAIGGFSEEVILSILLLLHIEE